LGVKVVQEILFVGQEEKRSLDEGSLEVKVYE
jgi:hypothetical protein